MDNHEILGLAIPTNEPSTAFNYLLNSTHNLSELAPISTILFNFQSPWNEELMSKAIDICKSAGFEVRYTYNSYEIAGKGLVPFNRIRGDACNLMPNAKFFMLMDDDFSFRGRTGSLQKSAGEQIIDVVHYLMTNPKCGFVLIKGNYYLKEVPKYVVAPAISLENRYITDKGIILRSFHDEGLVVPNDAIDLLGSDEEKVACSWRMYKGYYPAVINHARILHYENCNSTTIENAPKTGESMYQWNTKDILDANANKYIREHFYADFQNRSWRPTALVDPTQYYLVGGADVTEESFRSQHSIDYSGMTRSTTINEIIELYKEDC